jgi:hypothetical protein
MTDALAWLSVGVSLGFLGGMYFAWRVWEYVPGLQDGPDMSKVKTCPTCGAHSAPDKSERAS